MTNFQQRENQRVRVEISARTRLCEQILAVTCNPHEMDARLGRLEPKCLFKVQYLNNRFFAFSVKFLNIMRRSSRKCAVVTDHEKLIATLSQKDRALRGAWDILNGVLKGPKQAGEKWVIPKNHRPPTAVCASFDVPVSMLAA